MASQKIHITIYDDQAEALQAIAELHGISKKSQVVQLVLNEGFKRYQSVNECKSSIQCQKYRKKLNK